ncbi:hypothetical protein FACS189472_03390 [Alphaproteobacteria bacterium]|nr:hypothetical protein FACS189472_03390 [Alphaproteobacteria bacterium]
MSVEIDITTCSKVCIFSFLLALGSGCNVQAADYGEEPVQAEESQCSPYSNFGDVSATVDGLEPLVLEADLDTLRSWYNWLHCGVLPCVQKCAAKGDHGSEEATACVEKLNHIIDEIGQRKDELEANPELSPPTLGLSRTSNLPLKPPLS